MLDDGGGGGGGAQKAAAGRRRYRPRALLVPNARDIDRGACNLFVNTGLEAGSAEQGFLGKSRPFY